VKTNDANSLLISEDEAEILACRLNHDEQRDLMAAYASLGREHVLKFERERTHLVVTVSRSPASEAEIDRIVAIENECCPFMDIAVNRTAESLDLTYSGPPLIAPVIDMIEERLAASSQA
jgi:glycerol-3-phosphate dehydrogenase